MIRILVSMLAVLILACEPMHSDTNGLNNGLGAELALQVDPVLDTQAVQILQANCASCHGTNGSGNISNITDVQGLIKKGLIEVGDAKKGRLIGSIEDKSMPPSGIFSAGDLQILRNWINSMKWVPKPATPKPSATPSPSPTSTPKPSATPLPTATPKPTATPGPTATPAAATYTKISSSILQPKCVSCHGSTRASAGVRYDSYAETMKTVKAGNPNASRLYSSTANGSMPPAGALSAADMDAIKGWINSGAPNN